MPCRSRFGQTWNRPVLYEPENAEVRRRCYVSPRGVGHDEPAIPAGYSFGEFSWPEQVLGVAAAYPDRHDLEQAYLLPFQVRPFAGQSMSDLLFGEVPAFAVRFGWARQHLAALFEATHHGVGLVTGSFTAGIVISVVVGHLEVDPNPSERIYQLGTWG
jgi:hypothetical protein